MLGDRWLIGLDALSTDPDPDHWPLYSSVGVRDQTAELASIALDTGVLGTPPRAAVATGFEGDQDVSPLRLSSSTIAARNTAHPREPSLPASYTRSSSYLTHLIRKDQLQTPPPSVATSDVEEETLSGPATERDPLLPKYQDELHRRANVDEIPHDDLESQGQRHAMFQRGGGAIKEALRWPRDRAMRAIKGLRARDILRKAVVEPAKYLPSVLLGLLLNVLDGLSYGMILFPLGESIFSDLGPDGLSMFYVSCIVSQLVYSLGGSAFKGGIGSEMIEVVPFFHKMAFTIMAEVGTDNPKSVLATTILSYSISSVLTGCVFFALGYLKLGSLIGFFPRHILVGCIGGVGWFLLATAIEVCARLDGGISYDLDTLAIIFAPSRLVLWIVPLVLAIILIFCQRVIKSTLFMPLYFLSIPILFHIIVAAIPNISIEDLREKGWVFDAPASGAPWWHFYTLYDFHAVDWTALLKTVPAMFALTFFGILHVPINVPALGVSAGIDTVNVDRELIAHGVSNALSGFCGSIQNYLVYSNSILFMRAGGDSRVAGVMLAIGTFAIMVAGPAVVGYIPVMVVGALIFLLGIELMREALVDTWGKLSKLEYLTICAIVVTMGAWDFVIGILVGVLLACVSLVLQTSRKSPIRATHSGVVARSTVRRHPTQQRFLREVGSQIEIVKLAGYMFFGTITSVESYVHSLLDDHRTTRFVIIDLFHVSGIDFSSAEGFTRMRRLMAARGVEMVLSGVTRGGEIGGALRAVGVWGDDNSSGLVFESLNEALEYAENEFLKALYTPKQPAKTATLDVPRPPPASINDISQPPSSPRRTLVQNAAQTTLRSDEVMQSTKWASFRQPLPLILQTFQGMTDKNEDFWFAVVPYFERRVYEEGSVVFRRGDKSTEFFLIEEGIFRADYDLDQGRYSESIVAGTTCGELPFFSNTPRTATLFAEKFTVAWVMDEKAWKRLQSENVEAAMELLKIALKLTTERMHAITSYVLTSAG
ncbi:sulfate transporter family-domain-containing protein [Sphaerosporella brunnea]|uniref:Sulfate transporter family-domain-containing protein n=1 Tax=Sphaerosporella brunnea TaxID=1250544 RepID=A0A5J5EP26_9PEZI|nr:sulfate transporter family-domain-containing protein [Sphaerosporella brunnea]